MNEYVKQTVFSKERVKLYFLSPYVTISYDPVSIVLQRKDLDKCLRLKQPYNDKAKHLFSRLSSGLTLDEIISSLETDFGETNPKNWVRYCIQWGILE